MAEEKRYKFKKESDKSSVVLIGVLLVLIIIVGAALVHLVTQRGPMDEILPPPPPPGDNITDANVTNVTDITPPCDDQCLYERALRDKSFSDCQNITNTTLEQRCYEELSDVSLTACMAVESATVRKSCLTAFAVAEDNITLCDMLEEGVDECREAVDPCLVAEDKTLCYALKEEDPTRCQSDTDCLLNYSITKKDSEACDLIQNPAAAKGCISVVERKDRCSGLTVRSQKDYCYQIYAIYTDDVSFCPLITGSSSYALDCFSTFAARQGNPSLCDRTEFDLNTKWDCYTNYSLLSGDLEGCRQIHKLATTHLFECAFEYAKKYGNPSACGVIERASSRGTCYQGAILYSNENLDWRYCDDITDFEWRNKCFSESAKLYDDVSLCDYITVEYAKEACQIAYEVSKTG